MKLKNKKTGEKAEVEISYNSMLVTYEDGRIVKYYFDSLKDLEEWEDYEEPKEYWWIDTGSIPMVRKSNNPILSTAEDIDKSIGNYFETKEEAELAVRKLKAWKQLKDKGFRFDGWDENHHNLGIIEFSFDKVENNVWDFGKDLDLLFGGEE